MKHILRHLFFLSHFCSCAWYFNTAPTDQDHRDIQKQPNCREVRWLLQTDLGAAVLPSFPAILVLTDAGESNAKPNSLQRYFGLWAIAQFLSVNMAITSFREGLRKADACSEAKKNWRLYMQARRNLPQPGELFGPCTEDRQCSAGLICVRSLTTTEVSTGKKSLVWIDACYPDSPGTQDGPCYSDNTCDLGFFCDQEIGRCYRKEG